MLKRLIFVPAIAAAFALIFAAEPTQLGADEAPKKEAAQKESDLNGKQLYVTKGCLGCHGEAGQKPIAPTYPKIAGQSKEYALQQMKDIKSGKRDNAMSAVMRAVVAQATDAELAAIAAYLEEQPCK